MQQQNQPTTQVDWPALIREYREEGLRLTVLKFAYRFEVSPQAVYMWETGRRQAPYRVTAEVMAWKLGKEAHA